MRDYSSITVDINGDVYAASVMDRIPPDNEKVIIGRTIIIPTEKQDCSELDKLTEGSTVTITDKGDAGYYTDDYIYKGNNYKQHIFESTF